MRKQGAESPLERVLAVLVLYRSDLAASQTFRTLVASCTAAGATLDLFVHDNSPVMQVAESPGDSVRIDYHHDPSNPGISAAFNAGARRARKQGKKWLLLLDQDTSFPLEAITAYAAALGSGGAAMFVPQLLAGGTLLSPCGYLAGVGYHLSSIAPGSMRLHGRSILNSGLMVQVEAFEKCGGYDERVRVDFADFVFMNRFRRHYCEVMVLDLVCLHGFSNLETVDSDVALRRFTGYCRDGRAAAVTSLLQVTHAFLVMRRCLVLSLRYRSCRFLSRLPAYFSPGQRTVAI
jgi:glycosyltransferase involved in cell wall biosynthesis